MRNKDQFELIMKMAPYRPYLDALGVPSTLPSYGPDGSIEYPADAFNALLWCSRSPAKGQVGVRSSGRTAAMRWAPTWRKGPVLLVEASVERSSFRVWVETRTSVSRRYLTTFVGWSSSEGPWTEPDAAKAA